MNNVNYVDLETAKLLKDIGFDYWCESMYSHTYRVRDEIQEMYPGLSDCGYDDLLTKYGGPLKQTEVFGYYDERIRISSRNSKDYFEHHPNMICACPTFELALEWLRKEKGIIINCYPSLEIMSIKYLSRYYMVNKNGIYEYDLAITFDDYVKAMNETIKLVSLIIKKNIN